MPQGSTLPDVRSLSYEQAYAELEEIVYGLETNQKTLEEALSLFERGQAIAQHCADLLDGAELRVRQISDLGENDQDEEIGDEDAGFDEMNQ